MNELIYFDHAATTPVHPEVLQVMLPYFQEQFGNASSIHRYGQQAKQALDQARATIATQLGCQARELIFTSGGTESNNLAIRGIIANPQGKHVITSQVEHHAVLHVCQQLENLGCHVTYLPVDERGSVKLEDCIAAVRAETSLITIMFGNNEVGTLQPIEQIGNFAKSQNIPFHVDAVQALGNVQLNLASLPIDLLTLSAHKIGGPKGIGALFVRQGIPLEPQTFGGSQERGRRPGTENVAFAAGFAKALELAVVQQAAKAARLRQVRERLLDELTSTIGADAFVVNGDPQHGLAHILNLSFPGIRSATMLMNLDLAGIAASSGSACSAGSLEPSHVLKAMNLSTEQIHSAIRFSFNLDTNEKEILKLVKNLETICKRLRI